MTIGISEEHLALHDATRRWVETHADISVARAAMEDADHALPPFWDDLVKMGWLGLHLPEEYGGEGYGVAELAVVLEELGRVCAPGPFLPTVMTSAVINAMGSDEQKARWLPGLADGTTIGAVGLATEGPVLGGGIASLFVLPIDLGDGTTWYVVERDAVDAVPAVPTDPTRSTALVRGSIASSAGVYPLLGDDVARAFVGTLVAAECVGGAAWCVDTASAYAKERVQFGRPIGQFQAVKHRCANMLLRLEAARAATWDATRDGERDEAGFAASVAGALAPQGFFDNAKDCIQVLGGIGYTWEHDAHLYLEARAVVASVARRTPSVA